MKSYHFLLIVQLNLLLVGCTSPFTQYQMVSQSQVETSTSNLTKSEVIVIKEIPFIAFEEVIEKSPNVMSVTQITDLNGLREPSHFTISPINDDIVFQAVDEIDGNVIINLWRTSAKGGGGMTRLTAGRYLDMEPTYSRDGKCVYFVSNRSSDLPKICKISCEGATGLTRVTQSHTEDRFPSVCSESGQIFYMSKPNSNYDWQIWFVNENGSLPTQLKEGSWPVVSNNGNQILYCVKDKRSDKWKIWRMNTDGTEQTQLTTDMDCDDLYPSWSSTDKFVLYASDIGKDSNGKKNFDIWLMTIDGTNKTQLTTNGSTDMMPQFSADNRFVYFLSNRGFNWDIWRLSIGR